VLVYCLLRFTPYPELGQFREREYSTTILDRGNEVLWVQPIDREGLRREYVHLEDIPAYVKELFILSEDNRFYHHPGVDPFAILRSIFLYLKTGEIVSGASTITMQLASIISPDREVTLGPKILEMVDALRLETRLSKDRILELWLNNIPFGFQAEGVQTAGRTFFGNPVSGLSPEEALLLSVIPRSPALYNPFTEQENCVQAAFDIVIENDLSMSREEISRAAAGAVYKQWRMKAPHFVERFRPSEFYTAGGRYGKVHTSLDLSLNRFAEQRINYYLDRNADSRLNNGAVLLTDNHTGEILCYVGSRDFFDEKYSGQIDGVRIESQPGSCLKPFLYALALEEGMLPNTVLPDIPLSFGREKVYEPRNFDNRFHGPVRLRVALASSLNVPAVYTLNQVGVPEFTDFLLRLGFDSLASQRDQLGLGLALGNGEVNLWELTRAFAIFARRGVAQELTPLESGAGAGTESGSGSHATDDETRNRRVISRYSADCICDILSDSASRYLGFGRSPVFELGFPVMFKTGTANQFQHIWAVAATVDYTVGVWMGNFSGETIIGRTGSSLPARVAGELLQKVQRGSPDFPVPAGSREVTICTLSGKRPRDICPSTTTEYLPEEYTPEVCDFHRKADGKVQVELPDLYSGWIRDSGKPFSTAAGGEDGLTIVSPREGALFYIDPSLDERFQAVAIEAYGGGGHGTPSARTHRHKVTVLVNGEEVETIGPPYRWLFPLKPGRWTVTFTTGDSSDSVTFTVQ
jgi:penicillin-binding protein 1C